MSLPVMRRKRLTIKLSEYAVSSLVSLAMGYILAAVPWLAWGPIDNIIEGILSKFLKYLIEESIIGINTLVIEYVADSDAENMVEILAKARKAKHENKSSEEIKKIDDALKAELRDLIRYGRAPL